MVVAKIRWMYPGLMYNDAVIRKVVLPISGCLILQNFG